MMRNLFINGIMILLLTLANSGQARCQDNQTTPIWQANVKNTSNKKLKCEVTDNTHWHETYGPNGACVFSTGTVVPGNTVNFSLPLSNCPVIQGTTPPQIAIIPDPLNIGIVCYADNNAYVHTECYQLVANVISGSTVTMNCPPPE